MQRSDIKENKSRPPIWSTTVLQTAYTNCVAEHTATTPQLNGNVVINGLTDNGCCGHWCWWGLAVPGFSQLLLQLTATAHQTNFQILCIHENHRGKYIVIFIASKICYIVDIWCCLSVIYILILKVAVAAVVGASHKEQMTTGWERLPFSATLRFNSTLQCGRCYGYIHPHNPRGWNVAIPALALFCSLVLALGIYTTKGN